MTKSEQNWRSSKVKSTKFKKQNKRSSIVKYTKYEIQKYLKSGTKQKQMYRMGGVKAHCQYTWQQMFKKRVLAIVNN